MATNRRPNNRVQRLHQDHLAPQALIVDDDVESIQPLQIVLQQFGFETTLAFDGKEALDEISKKNFDVVFLDIVMPEMTGLEALKKVEEIQRHDRKYFKRAHPVPVVTYTSYAVPSEIGNGKNFFIADRWQKPVSLPDLAKMTSEIVDQLGIKMKGSHEV